MVVINQMQGLKPAILATQEVVIERIAVKSQAGGGHGQPIRTGHGGVHLSSQVTLEGKTGGSQSKMTQA
jgi:hypothetical protein